MFASFSLRQWLTVPYVVLIIGVSVTIGLLSYRTGSETVDTLSNNLLLETIQRIEQAVDRHLLGSGAVLEAAFPQGLSAPADIGNDVPGLRARLWTATSLHTDPNNFVYYGNEAGQTIGMLRRNNQQADLIVRRHPGSTREVYALWYIDQPLPAPEVTQLPVDPRQRPWYKQALTSKSPVWTSVYIDAITSDLVVTRAKRVNDRQGRLQGVAATDVALQQLNRFVRSLRVSANGIAFVIEPNGDLIASSRTPNVRQAPYGGNTRVNASDGDDAMQKLAYEAVLKFTSGKPMQTLSAPESTVIQGLDGAAVQVAFDRLRDDSGLDWLVIVAVPRNDFMQGVTENVMQTLAIGVAAATVAVLLGLLLLQWLGSDLQTLTRAAERIGKGNWDEPVTVRGKGGIATLAHAVQTMQARLRTDPLTGLYNREAVMRAISDRMQAQPQAAPFALLFVDLDRFKLVNDTLGHDAGDKVLIEMADRLQASTREGDVVGRYAGDEFLILLDKVSDPALAEHIRQEVQSALGAPLKTLDTHQHPGLGCGGTVGVTCYPAAVGNAEDLVALADQDMYRRKTGSRPRG